MKVIIVDDSRIFREGLKFFIQENSNWQVISEASNGQEFLELNNLHLADIVLIDIEMPVMDGIEATKKVLWQHPNLKIIAITMYMDKVYLKQLNRY